MDAVSVLHSSNPPILHRDLKLENLLINSKCNGIKLCDFGSATTETIHPNVNWTMNQVTLLFNPCFLLFSKRIVQPWFEPSDSYPFREQR